MKDILQQKTLEARYTEELVRQMSIKNLTDARKACSDFLYNQIPDVKTFLTEEAERGRDYIILSYNLQQAIDARYIHTSGDIYYSMLGVLNKLKDEFPDLDINMYGNSENKIIIKWELE